MDLCVQYSSAINRTAAVVSWTAGDLTQLLVTCFVGVCLCVCTYMSMLCGCACVAYVCLLVLYLVCLDEALWCLGENFSIQ